MWLHPGVLTYTCVQSDGSFGQLTALPSPPLVAAHVPTCTAHTPEHRPPPPDTGTLCTASTCPGPHTASSSTDLLQSKLSPAHVLSWRLAPLRTALDSCPVQLSAARAAAACTCSGPGTTWYSASSLDGSQTTFLRSGFQPSSVTHSFTWHPRWRIPRSPIGEAGSDFALSDGVWSSVLLGPDSSWALSQPWA